MTMPVQATRTLIGKGIYDSDEVAHLTGPRAAPPFVRGAVSDLDPVHVSTRWPAHSPRYYRSALVVRRRATGRHRSAGPKGEVDISPRAGAGRPRSATMRGRDTGQDGMRTARLAYGSFTAGALPSAR